MVSRRPRGIVIIIAREVWEVWKVGEIGNSWVGGIGWSLVVSWQRETIVSIIIVAFGTCSHSGTGDAVPVLVVSAVVVALSRRESKHD